MSSYATTCPRCDKTHRFTLLPERGAVKESGVEYGNFFRQTRTSKDFAEKIQALE